MISTIGRTIDMKEREEPMSKMAKLSPRYRVSSIDCSSMDSISKESLNSMASILISVDFSMKDWMSRRNATVYSVSEWNWRKDRMVERVPTLE